jgi:predicted dehydrogenase
MRRIQTAVIGAGFIGPAHVEAIRRLGFADVVVLAEIDPAVAAAKAGQLGLPRYTSNMDEVLSDAAIEVVHVCTPNNLHFEVAKKALQAGKHVVCEKPLAMTSDEAEDLVRTAAERGKVGAIHFNNRSYPLTRHARTLVEAGELGEITVVHGVYLQDWLFYATDYNWRLEPQQSGATRAVGDIGSHWLDLAEYISCCSVTEVCADFATFIPVRQKPIRPMEAYAGKLLSSKDYRPVEIQTEDYAAVLLRFAGRARGSFTVCQVASGRKNYLQLEVYGTKKSLAWNSENPNELWIGRRDGNNETVIKDPSLLDASVRHFADLPGGHAEGFDNSIKQTIRRVYTYIVQDGAAKGLPVDFPVFADGLRELRLCDAIVESARDRRWVRVEVQAAGTASPA